MKKKIHIPLLIFTVVIWGFVLYSFTEAVWFNVEDSENQERYSQKNNYKITPRSSKEFEYENLDNDPFQSRVLKPHIEMAPKEPEIIEQNIVNPLINFSVTGVVINGTSKKIVFNDNTNLKVVFLKEGETYQDLHVVEITKKNVEFIQITTGDKLISPIQ